MFPAISNPLERNSSTHRNPAAKTIRSGWPLRYLMLCLAWMSLVSVVAAEEKPPAPEAAANQRISAPIPTPVLPPPVLDITEIQQIYLPGEFLGEVIAKQGKSALLSRDEFEKLVKAARDSLKWPTGTSQQPVIGTSDYQVTVSGQRLVAKVTISITTSNPASTVDLPVSGWSVESATLKGEPVAVARTGPDWNTLRVFFPNAGTHSLQLTLSCAMQTTGSDQLAGFQLLGGSNGTFQLSLPTKKIVLANGLTFAPEKESESPVVYKIPIGGQPKLELTITDRNQATQTDLLTFANTLYHVAIQPGEVTWNAVTQLQVYGHQINQLDCRIPSNLEITQVESEGLESWTLEDDESNKDQTRLILKYRLPFDGQRRLSVRGILSPALGQAWTVPQFQIEDITAHTGAIWVNVPDMVRVQTVNQNGVRPTVIKGASVDATKPGQTAIDFSSQIAFDVWRDDFQLEFLTELKESPLQAAITNVLLIRDSTLVLSSTIGLQPRRSPVFEVRLRLPADYYIDTVEMPGVEVTWEVVNAEAGVQELRIQPAKPLQPGQIQTLAVHATHEPEGWPIQQTPMSVPLPYVKLMQAGMVEILYGICADTVLEVSPVDVVGLDPARKAEMESLNQKLTQQSESLRLGFAGQETTYQGQLQIARRPGTLTAETVSLFRVERETVTTQIQSRLSISGGGVRSLKISASEQAGDQLRFTLEPVNDGTTVPAKLLEQVPGAPINGVRPWLLNCDQPLRGVYLLKTRVSLPRGAADEFQPVELRFTDATAQSGFIAVNGAEDEDVRIVDLGADGQPLQIVDPIDFPTESLPSTARVVAGFRYAQPGWSLKVTSTQFAKGSIPSAVGSQLKMTSVFSDAGLIQQQGILNFTAVGMQNLVVDLPANSRLWAALIDDQPVEIRQATDGLRIPLSQLNSNQSHTLKLLFDQTNEEIESVSKQSLIPPRFAITSGTGQEQPLPILEQTWDVHYPDSLVVLNSRGVYQPQSSSLFNWNLWVDRARREIGAVSIPELLFKLAALALFGGTIYFLVSMRAKTLASGCFYISIFILTVIVVLSLIFVMSTVRHEGRVQHDKLAPTQTLPEAHPAVELSIQERSSIPMPKEPAAPTSAPVGRMAPQAPPVSDLYYYEQGKSIRKEKQNARLSLAATLHIPEDSQHQQFLYRGNLPPGQETPLLIKTADRTTAQMIQLILAVSTAAIGWMLRNASSRTRRLWAVMTFVLPLAVLSLTFGWTEIVVAGIFLGGAASLIFWGLYCLGQPKCNDSQKSLQPQSLNGISCGLIIAASLLTGSPLLAQDSQKPAPPKPQAPYVVIPYTSLETLTAADRVWVPPALYEQLWKQAHPETGIAIAGTEPASIAEANYVAEVEPGAIAGRIRITARWVAINQTETPQTLRLPVRKVSVQNAKIGTENAAITVDKDGFAGVVLPKRGLHLIDAEFIVLGEVTKQSGQFVLETDRVTAGALTFFPPESKEPQRLLVNGGSNLFQRLEVNKRSAIQTPVDRGGKISISWQPERQQSETSNVQHLESTLAVSVSDVGLNQRQDFQLTVRQGAVAELRFVLPEGLSVRQLSGSDLAGWGIASGENEKRHLTVQFRREVADQTKFQIELFQPIASDEDSQNVELKTLEPVEVTRETGRIGIESPAELKVAISEAKGLQQIDAASFPKELFQRETPATFSYRYAARPFQLQLQLERRAGNVHAIADHGVHLGLRKLAIATRIRLKINETPRRQFEILVPQGFQTLDVVCAECTDWYVINPGGDEDQRLTIELDRPRTGEIELSLTGQFPRDSAPQEVAIILPMPVADQHTNSLGIWLEPGDQASIADSGSWKSVPPETLPEDSRKLRSEPAQFALTSTGEPEEIRLDVRKLPPEVRVDAAICTVVGDATIDYGMTFRWTVTQSSTDTFAVTTPDWLGQLDFDARGVRQIRSEPGERGFRRWIISVIEPVQDQFLITAAATVALPADQIVKTPQLYFPMMSGPNPFAELQSQRQFAVLVNLSPNQLSPTDPKKIEPLTVDDLPLNLPNDLIRQAVQIVRVREKQHPEWKIDRPQRVESSRALVLSAMLTTVLQRDGSWRSQAIYGVRNRGQQFLALQIPPDSEILSVTVRNVPSRTVLSKVGDKPVQLIPLPQTSSADLSFDVNVILAGKLSSTLPSTYSVFSRKLAIPAPTILTPKDSPEFGVSTAQTVWNVYVPDHFKAVPDTDPSRTNVVWHEESGWYEAEMQAIQRYRSDLAELNRVLTDFGTSSSSQSLVKQNLKQLKDQIRGRQSSFGSYDPVFAPFQQESEKLLQDLEKAEQLSNATQVSPESKATGSGAGNRGIVTNLNEAIISSNSIQDRVIEQKSPQADESFGFSLSELQISKGRRDNQADEHQERSRLRSQIQQQAPIIRRNAEPESNLPIPSGKPQSSPAFSGQSGGPASGNKRTNLNRHLSKSGGMGGMGGGMADTDEMRVVGGMGGMKEEQLGNRIQKATPAIKGETSQELLPRDTNSDTDALAAGVPQAKRTEGGSLSIPVILPVTGHELSFSRVGGNPELSLQVSGTEWRTWASGLLWTIPCLLIAAAVFWWKSRCHQPQSVFNRIANIAILLSILGVLLSSGDLTFLFIILFLVAVSIKCMLK
ncbi:hypothetical protein [Planctomicrobium sp. SH527]|uniref:hypothetical protein n=1 Tax=Planctomicrobium sp. SH527 TaxID=3448123 RepID=UPI003F5C0710